MVKKNRWGVVVFLIALLIVALVIKISFSYPLFLSRKNVTISGILFSLITFACGHFSYPRVHNLKIYLIGYTFGLCGLGYFLINDVLFKSHFPVVPQGMFCAFLIIVFFNCFIFLTVPSFVKFRNARSITLALFTAEAVLIAVARINPLATIWTRYLYFNSYQAISFWLGPFVFVLILILSILLLRDSFYLGGTISGIAFLSCVIWIIGINENSPTILQSSLYAVAPLFIFAAIMIHWFSRMDHRISYDPLLQIYNRDYCSKIISEQSNLNTAPPFTIAMVDIDHFKNVNDTYGHQAGDEVLYSVAQAVQKGVVPLGIACRYGGEELAVFFPKKNAKDIVKIMDQVRVDTERISTKSGNKEIKVTVSCGVAQRDELSQSIEDVLHAADKALYKAKKGGRNQVKSGKV